MESSVDISPIVPGASLRVIPYESFHGAFNMAVDFFLAQSIQPEDDPVLRFYGWNPPCLSIGRHQDESLVSRKALKEQGVDLVRRPTGGSAILHDAELTYSLIVPDGQERHHAVYEAFHRLLAEALHDAGYAVDLHKAVDKTNYLKDKKNSFACFNRPAFTEIKYQGKKLVGSAQKMYRHSLLQHGSIMISGRQDRVLDFLNMSDEEKEKRKADVQKKAVSLEEIASNPPSVYDISSRFTEVFARHGVPSIYYRQLTREERKGAETLCSRFDSTLE